MNFSLYVARKIYTRGRGLNNKVSKPAIRIATLGVTIGLSVMIISVSVVLGFKNSIRDKVVGFGSHIIVTNILNIDGAEQYPIAINKDLTRRLTQVDGVKKVERYAYTEGVLKTNSDFLGIMLKGIGPEYDLSFIHENLREGNIPNFSDKKSQNKIVISETIAQKLNLHVGDKAFAYFLNRQGVRMRYFKIAGIYATNMKQFDSQICFTDLYTTQKLNGWKDDQYGGVELLIKDFNNLHIESNKISHLVKDRRDKYNNTYAASNIISQYPQIFSWLNLMDMNVWIILGLMIAVAGVTMVSGLLIIILERTQMIGTMKALGCRNKQIRHIFLWFATFVIGKGLLFGNIIGVGIILLQRYTGFIKLDPQTYYVNIIPVEINILLILALNIITMIVCVLVLIAPSYLVSRINPAKSMQYE
ncbi:ABC transporter permease [Prevotella amnii]|uniref:ABC transporter permease n=1 Tax=Prevotella amnii TaxID=419005 RepID=UPI0003621188|nr:FtsX-like permease family protein [Prevotella amnii]